MHHGKTSQWFTWSGTGNTQAMAEAIAQTCNGVLIEAGISPRIRSHPMTPFAFGCPSMGTEQLEESVFAPLFEACKPLLQGKKLALFGSYGWGDGEWMRTWRPSALKPGQRSPAPASSVRKLRTQARSSSALRLPRR